LRLEYFMFSPKRKPMLTIWVARELLGYTGLFKKRLKISLDLGVSEHIVEIEHGRLFINDFNIEISLKELNMVKGETVYVIEADGEVKPLKFFSGKHYRLRSVAPYTAPTLEINGIHMHRIQRVTPWEDAMLKTVALKPLKKTRVLDICTGLGYTALNALKAGAYLVDTVEMDENVLWIAERNPWSLGLNSSRIRIILGRAEEAVKKLPSNHYDRILHDPPRFTSESGALYSLEFYIELYRLLEPGGKLFHYTGEPGKRRMSFLQGVARRLRNAGFTKVFYNRMWMGYIAFKPRNKFLE